MRLATSVSTKQDLLGDLLREAEPSRPDSQASLTEFVSRGGVNVLCQWAKDVKQDVQSSSSGD
jgi:hypothetical protein